MKKKVAIFTNNLMAGGAERIVSYLLNMGYKRFDFHLILLRNNIAYEIPGEEHVKIFELEGEGGSRFSTIIHMKSLSRKLRQYLEQNNIDTVLSLLNRCNLIASKVKQSGWKGKLIISERADTIAYYKSVRFGWIMLWYVKKFYRFADEVTVISKGIARSLEKLGIPGSRVIYNPVFPVPSRPVIEKERPFTFINVARFYPQKNHALLIKAFALLQDKHSVLRLVGTGVLLEPSVKLAAELNISDRVKFEGYQKDVNGCLLESDCFVFSSDYEGLGNAIIEALQAGLPVISTDCPSGPREILAPDTAPDVFLKEGMELGKYGVLTPVGDEKQLAMAMQKIIDDRDLREKYRQLAPGRLKDFDLAKTMESYFELF